MAAMLDYQMLVAKCWYFLFSGALVFVTPYLSLFLMRDLGYAPWLVGLIQGLRPWVSAPSSFLLCALADRLAVHRGMLLVCFACSTALRGSLALVPPGNFAAVAAVILLAEVVGAPVGVIADASVVAKCKQDGDYGKQRVWASIGWGGLSTVAGALISHTGVRYGILVYVLLSVPNLVMAWLLNPGPKKPQPAADAKQSGAPAGQNEAAAGKQSPSSPLAAGRRLALPLSHSARHGHDHDGDLRTRLLAASVRTPSPCLPSPSGSPARGPSTLGRAGAPEGAVAAAAAAAPLAPLLVGGTDSDADSCCSTPRSTAALLGDHDRSAPATPSPHGGPQSAAANADGGAALCPAPEAAAAAAALPGSHPAEAQPVTSVARPADAAEAAAFAAASEALRTGTLALSSMDVDQPTDDEEDAVAVLTIRRGDSRRALLSGKQDSAAPPLKAAAASPTDNGATLGAAPAAGGGDEACSIGELLLRPTVMVFMLRALVIGFGLGTQGAFAFLLVQQLGGNELLMGLMLVFSILTEAPAFQFQSVLLARVPVAVVMHVSMVLLAVRLAAYALLPYAPTVWAVLPIELLHGVTFATSWGAGIVSCKRMAPAHLNTTVQSIFAALYGGVGSGLGAILGGVAMQRCGIQSMFAMSSAALLGGWLLAWLLDGATALAQRRRAAIGVAAGRILSDGPIDRAEYAGAEPASEESASSAAPMLSGNSARRSDA